MAGKRGTAARDGLAVPEEQVRRFERDGAVCLRGVIASRWVERLQAGVDRVLARKGMVADMALTVAGHPVRHVREQFLWRQDPDVRAFILESGAGAIAGQLLRSDKVNVLFDHLRVREPVLSEPLSWRQDLPCWPIDGDQALTLWVPLDPLTLDTGAVEYVKGSHLWGGRYHPVLTDTPENHARANKDPPDCPPIHQHRDAYEILCWDLQPGDCVAAHGLTLYSSGGNHPGTQRRRGLTTCWTGDDVTFMPGNVALNLPEDPGLTRGDALDSGLFPVVWRRRGV